MQVLRRYGFACLILLSLTRPAQAAPWYTVQELPIVPVALNDRGQVTGYTESLGVVTPYLWHRGRLTPLGALGTARVLPSALNNAGQVAGHVDLPTDARGFTFSLPFVWQDGEYRFPPLGDGWGAVSALNNHGLLGGGFQAQTGEEFLFRWRAGRDRLRDTLTEYRGAGVGAINDRGVVAAGGYNADGFATAFLWDGETVTVLPPLPDAPVADRGATCALAFGLNDRGVAVGQSLNADYEPRPVRWIDGEIRLLADAIGWAQDVNDAGWIVGQAGFRGFLWTPRDGLMDLRRRLIGSRGWESLEPTAINNLGQIIATGVRGDRLRAVLLTPWPLSIWN